MKEIDATTGAIHFFVAFARRVALSKQIPALHSGRFAASRPRSADFIV
jgi:hypothetical protein